MARKSRLTAYEQGIRALENNMGEGTKVSVRNRLTQLKEQSGRANNRNKEEK